MNIKRQAGALAVLMASVAMPAGAIQARHPAHAARHPASLRNHFRHAAATIAHAIGRTVSHLWSSPAVAVFDHASGLPLYVEKEHETDKHSMASTTKMMTAMVFADYVQAQGGNWDMPVEITPADQKLPGGHVNMVGPHSRHPVIVKLTARQLLLAMMVHSCNAAAEAALRYAGNGDWAKGLTIMNERREGWSMFQTEYANGSGWKNPRHYSTVTDMEVPLRHLIDDQRYAEVAKAARTPSFDFPGGPYDNHNLLLQTLPGMREGKTGWTDGFSFVGSFVAPDADKKNFTPYRIDICVLGDRSRQHRDHVTTEKLIDVAAHYHAYLAAAQEKAASHVSSTALPNTPRLQ